MSWLSDLLQRPAVTWWDLLDIAIVSIIVYELLKLIRGTRAVQMAIGIAVVVGLFYMSLGLQLETLNWLIRNIVGYVVFAAIVLMQRDERFETETLEFAYDAAQSALKNAHARKAGAA